MLSFFEKWELLGEPIKDLSDDKIIVSERYFSLENESALYLTSSKEFFCLTDLRKITQKYWEFSPIGLHVAHGQVYISSYLYQQNEIYYFDGSSYYLINNAKLTAFVESQKIHLFKSHLFSWPRVKDTQFQSILTKRVIDRIQENIEVPPLPPTTDELLELKTQPHPPLDKLVSLIERDPILTAQVLSWARSAFYGYRGDVSTVKEAIVRVLGIEIVLNLCLCLSLKKSFNLPDAGPLAWKNLWHRSLLTAELSRMIASESNLPLDENYLYLGGLLCDFGYFVLGHCFKPHFDILSEELKISPRIDPCLLEFHLFEFSHQHLGAWLLSKWNFPVEVLACVQWHHHTHVPIPHALYPQTVLMARYILSSYGVGDEFKSARDMQDICEKFGSLEKWRDYCEKSFQVHPSSSSEQNYRPTL